MKVEITDIDVGEVLHVVEHKESRWFLKGLAESKEIKIIILEDGKYIHCEIEYNLYEVDTTKNYKGKLIVYVKVWNMKF